MVYGIINLINFAHGEIYMIAAFLALVVGGILTILNFPIIAIFAISLVVAIIFSSLHSYTMEKIAYLPLRNTPRLSALISAIGMSLFLQNYVRLVQTSDFVRFPAVLPEINLGEVVGRFIGTSTIFIYASTASVMVILTLLIKYTRVGKAMRAASQDLVMAQLTGVPVNRIISITFVIGSVTAALGGVLISSHIGHINFYIGFTAGIKAFVAAVLGGIGSIPGAVIGSFVLGITESFGAGYISSDYEDVFAFLILILVLIFKPSGILGREGSQKV